MKSDEVSQILWTELTQSESDLEWDNDKNILYLSWVELRFNSIENHQVKIMNTKYKIGQDSKEATCVFKWDPS